MSLSHAHHSHAPDASGEPRGIEHSSPQQARRLRIVFVMVLVYAVAEALGGLYTGSLALLADAGHMVSDVAALGVALTAIWLARRPATSTFTYGLRRAEVLGALLNAVALIVIAIFIFVEAAERFRDPPEVLGGPMLLVALGGLVVNLVGVMMLHGGHRDSLNVRGAWLHMIADTLGSLGAIASAILIWQFGLGWADPAASVVIGCLVMWSSIALLRDTVEVLLESAPPHVDVESVRDLLVGDENVASVHDLHVWTISSGHEALTAHLVTAGTSEPDLVVRLRDDLRSQFGIDHVTLQVEEEEPDCEVDDCCY